MCYFNISYFLAKNLTTFICVCSAIYTGRICGINIYSPCILDPCKNGGICIPISHHGAGTVFIQLPTYIILYGEITLYPLLFYICGLSNHTHTI